MPKKYVLVPNSTDPTELDQERRTGWTRQQAVWWLIGGLLALCLLGTFMAWAVLGRAGKVQAASPTETPISLHTSTPTFTPLPTFTPREPTKTPTPSLTPTPTVTPTARVVYVERTVIIKESYPVPAVTVMVITVEVPVLQTVIVTPTHTPTETPTERPTPESQP